MKLVGTIRSLSFQMAFAQRFNEVTYDINHIGSLEENRKYPIEHADRVTSPIRRNDPVEYKRRRGGSSVQGVPPLTVHLRIQGRRCTGH